MAPNYVGTAKSKCKKKSGQECFVFARGYTIVWQNGINNKRKLTKKEIQAGKTLQILHDLGFYDGPYAKIDIESTTSTNENKKKAAEKKRLKEEKKRVQEAKAAERKRLKEEKKRLQEAKAAESKRLKEEKKRLLEAKKAEKKRLQEEKKAAAKAAKAKDTGTSITKQIKELNKLYKKGLLTEEEFKEAKKQIINN